MTVCLGGVKAKVLVEVLTPSRTRSFADTVKLLPKVWVQVGGALGESGVGHSEGVSEGSIAGVVNEEEGAGRCMEVSITPVGTLVAPSGPSQGCQSITPTGGSVPTVGDLSWVVSLAQREALSYREAKVEGTWQYLSKDKWQENLLHVSAPSKSIPQTSEDASFSGCSPIGEASLPMGESFVLQTEVTREVEVFHPILESCLQPVHEVSALVANPVSKARNVSIVPGQRLWNRVNMNFWVHRGAIRQLKSEFFSRILEKGFS
ncbi:hypothetical protein QJS10_CPB12g00513 [Acorus calamus]|uniref:Uncharacterized protein n=1 Tax=Acorus calamus TaxID=4465 RepID=A0AAV9DKC8_ACOCL|nr:hypothetical protein QJS10_CPB12g00513 [Acorus calamus]